MMRWVLSIMASTSYFGLAFLMCVENVFPPIPSEVIMPLAGYLVHKGQFSLVSVIVAGTIGSVIGALPLYYLGQRLGEQRLKEFADRHGRWLTFCRADIESSQYWFARHGGAAVFFCRLIPGIRSLISIPAGIGRMSLPAFLAYTTAGSALWTAALAYLGYLLGSRFRQVDEYLDPISWVVFGVIALVYVVRVIRHK